MFSLSKINGILVKELLQLKRERMTFGMILMMPIAMLLLFGYAINSDPRLLPTAVIGGGQSEYTRTIVTGLMSSGYYEVMPEFDSVEKAETALKQGKIQFVITFPSDFTVNLLRGEAPDILVEADATDPAAVTAAISALQGIMETAMEKDMGHFSLNRPYDVIVHSRYNPERITRYNIVPGIVGIVLTMTLIMMTGLSMTRELERGTMENLLVMPVRSAEVITGKILPYVGIGAIQAVLIFVIARFLFNVPFVGSMGAVVLTVLLFEVAILTVGITFSSIAKSQRQAMQMTIFFFVPNLLLSGFMFPFRGMPDWAQMVGSLLPLTYFMRMIRGVLLKGNTIIEMWPSIWPLLVFTALMMLIALKAYRKTLD